MIGSWRTTAAGWIAAVAVLLMAVAAVLKGDFADVSLSGVIEALSTIGLGGALAYLGIKARDDKVSSEEAGAK